MCVLHSVVTIQAVGFQGLSMTYTLQYEDTVSSGIFGLDPASGVLSLLVAREHIRHPRQYRMMVTALEGYTGYASTTDVSNLMILIHDCVTYLYGVAMTPFNKAPFSLKFLFFKEISARLIPWFFSISIFFLRFYCYFY